MNDLTVPLTEIEKVRLGNELEKLFVFQDRPIGKDKKVLLVEELGRAGLPFEALIRGIQKLMHEDLRAIKLATIQDAAEEFIHHEAAKKDCKICTTDGYVTLRDDEGRYFTMACKCEAGLQRANRLRIARWNGFGTQFVRGRRLYLQNGPGEVG